MARALPPLQLHLERLAGFPRGLKPRGNTSQLCGPLQEPQVISRSGEKKKEKEAWLGNLKEPLLLFVIHELTGQRIPAKGTGGYLHPLSGGL